MKRTSHGFTLIELLIVVAIIGILAAIAVPNFLNAQVRAKVGRARAELRSIRTAMETYRLDNNQYLRRDVINRNDELALLTTPIAYLSFIPLDPFSDPIYHPDDTSITLHAGYYVFENFDQEPGFVSGVPLYNDAWKRGAKYSVLSVGPDGDEGFNNGGAYNIFHYNPSNGVSNTTVDNIGNGNASGINNDTISIETGNSGTTNAVIQRYTYHDTKGVGGEWSNGVCIAILGTPTVTCLMENCDIIGAAGPGVEVYNQGKPESLVMDFGGGSLGSVGHNRFCNNRFHLALVNADAVAKYNWWGTSDGLKSSSVYGGNLPVFEPFLTEDPRPEPSGISNSLWSLY